MAFSNYAKKRLMADESFDAADKYIALSDNGTDEYTGHGYSRALWATSNMTVNNTTGVVTGSEITIFTASDGSASKPTHVRLYDASSAGNAWTDWQAIPSAPAAPQNGQQYRATPTLTP